MDRFSAHLDRAWQLMSRGDSGGALLAARQALGLDEESPEVHNLLGCIYAMDGDFDEAMSCYQKAVDLDDDYLDPLLNAAELLVHSQARPEEALDLCRKARELIELEEEQIEVALLETDALLGLGRAEEARKVLADIENVEFEIPAHFMLVGRSMFEIGEFEKSRELIKKALAADPSSADAWYCQGLLYREEGRRVNAVQAFLTVLKDDASRPAPSWLSEPSAGEKIVNASLSLLSDELRAMLDGTTIHVLPLPSQEQVMDELDPRQAVFAQTVNGETGAFLHLWIFYLNFEHAGILPLSPESDLAELLQEELVLLRR